MKKKKNRGAYSSIGDASIVARYLEAESLMGAKSDSVPSKLSSVLDSPTPDKSRLYAMKGNPPPAGQVSKLLHECKYLL